jgi:LPXTG-motif cell wall-anchored protein
MKKMMLRLFIALMVLFGINFIMTEEVIADEVMSEVTIETTLAPLSKDTSSGKFEEDIIKEDKLEEDRKLSTNIRSAVEDKNIKKDNINKINEVPQTGDASNLLMWIIILVIALITMVVMGYFIFRKKR